MPRTATRAPATGTPLASFTVIVTLPANCL